MKREAIKAEMLLKQQALVKLLESNNLTASTALTTEQLSILESTYKVLGLSEAPQDIGKKTFVEYVQGWVDEILGKLEYTRTDITVNVADAIRTFNSYTSCSKFPIGNILYNGYMKPALKQLGKRATPKAIGEALTGALTTFKEKVVANFEKTKHYKKNREAYSKIKKEELKGMLMTPKELNDWLTAAIKEGQSYKVNQEIDKQQQKDKEEQLKRDFVITFNNYVFNLAKAVNSIQVNNPKILSDSLIMDINLFDYEINKALDDNKSRNYPISKNLLSFLEEKVFSGEPFCEIQEVREHLNEWIRGVSSKSPWYEAQFEEWKESYEGFPIPALIAAAVNDSYIDIDADTVRKNLMEWTASVKDGFVMPKNYTIVIEKARKNFRELFDATAIGGVSIRFFYEDILDDFLQQQGAKASLSQLNTVWKEALSEVSDSALVATYFGKWQDKYGPYAIKSFNEQMDTLMPSVLAIQQVLLKSVERKNKIIIPGIQKDRCTLRMMIKMRSSNFDGHIINKELIVDLKYENHPVVKSGQLEDYLVVVPYKVTVGPGNSEESAPNVELITSKIKRFQSYKEGGGKTKIKLLFFSGKDVKLLFNKYNVNGMKYDGINFGYLLQKMNINVGASVGANKGANVGANDFIYNKKIYDYFEVEFTVSNAIVLGKGKSIKLGTSIECKNEAYEVSFEDGSTYIEAPTSMEPRYEYK